MDYTELEYDNDDALHILTYRLYLFFQSKKNTWQVSNDWHIT